MTEEYTLVTGVAGFVGARTAELLLDNGQSVLGLDSLNDYYDIRIKQYRLGRLQNREGFQFHELDIEDGPALIRLIQQFRIGSVVHLAARAGVRNSMMDPLRYLRTNTEGTLNVLEAMRRCGLPKLVMASTSSLYAGHPPPFLESMPVDTPRSPYAATKKAAEVLAATYHQLYGIDVSILRFFTVYGPAGRPDMAIFRFIHWIDQGHPITVYGDGHQSRDFTYIDDIARGTVSALRPLGLEVINLGGGGPPVSLLRVLELLEAMLGRKAVIDRQPFHVADLTETRADVSKAASLLGWHPTISLVTGLERSVAWYLDNREWLSGIRMD